MRPGDTTSELRTEEQLKHYIGEFFSVLRAVDNGAGNWTIEADINGDGNADLVIGVSTADWTYMMNGADFLP